MNSVILNQRSYLWRSVVLTFLLFALLAIILPAFGTPLLLEHFDENVPDQSPVGRAPGWHVWAVSNGVAVDYTTSIPDKDNYPALAHTDGGAKSGPWQWSVGYFTTPSYVVSNALLWVDTPTNFQVRPPAGFSYYSRNDSADSSTRMAVRVGGRWYVSTKVFHDPGNTDWVLDTLRFKSDPGRWQILKTNNLALGEALTGPLPKEDVTALGIYCLISGWGRVRLDEFQVVGSVPFDAEYQVGSWIWAEKRVDRKICRFWKLIEIPDGFQVKRATLRITAHDTFHAFLDGNDCGLGSDWTSLNEYDLKKVLTPGRHVLTVEAFNEYEWAGLVAGLVLESKDGRKLQIGTDESWRIVPDESNGWRTRVVAGEDWTAATILFPFQDAPGLPKVPKINLLPALEPVVIPFWQQGWFQLMWLGLCLGLAGFCLRLLARVALQSKERQALQRERARIARDIHDDLGAVVTQLVLQGETAQSELAAEPETRAKFKRISDTGRRLVQSINEVVWMINSQRDSLQDFENYVCRYAETFLRASSIRCRLDVDGEIPEAAFDLACRRSLFLAIKEALNNAVKYSGATEVLLKIHLEADEVTVTVEDDGQGFDPVARARSGNGLSNMAQRMAEVGGECRIVSRPGAGCRVELSANVADLSGQRRGWWQRMTAKISPKKSKHEPSA
jgi:two-component sensor histidine kinase